MRRVGVIGSVNRDVIHRPGEPPVTGLGGVLYSVVALAWLGRPETQVWPLLRLGRGAAAALVPVWEATPGVCLDGLQVTDRPDYCCDLHYHPDGSKSERLTGGPGALDPAGLAAVLPHLDAVLVNFITGYELRLDDWVALRRRLPGPVFMDVHSLTLGRRRSGWRYWRQPRHWQAWLATADQVQLNHLEAEVLAGRDPTGAADPAALGPPLLACGPARVVVTLGGAGAVGWEKGAPCGAAVRVAADRPDLALDATGCGDVFLAAAAMATLRGHAWAAALTLASAAAAFKSRHLGVASLTGLPPIAATSRPTPAAGLPRP